MNCPVCNSLSTKILQEFEKSITSDLKMISEKIVTEICTDCGNIFNSSGARNKTVNFYQNSYELHSSSFETETQIFDSNNISSISDWRLKHILSLNILSSFGKILDIGCGKGNFLKEFKFAFDKWELFGIESSKLSLNIAKQNFPNFIFHEGIYKKNIFDNKFNFIVAFNVLEHIEDPKDFLEDIYCDLIDGGYFCFDVPNFKLNPADLLVYDHLSHFTSETLKNLLTSAGFEIIKIIEDKDKVPLLIICKKSIKKSIKTNFFPMMKKLVSEIMYYNNELFSTYKLVNKNFEKIGVIGVGIPVWFAIQNKIIDSSKIVSFFDENSTIIGSKLENFEIKSLDTISEDNSLPLIFSASPCYIEKLSEKINQFSNKQFFPESYSYYLNYFSDN